MDDTPTKKIADHILSAYSDRFRPERVRALELPTSLGTCRYWQVVSSDGLYCLRRWPKSGVKKEHLQFLQAVLWQSVCEGIEFVPLPLETNKNQGFISFNESFWELLPWQDDDFDMKNEFFIPCHFPLLETETDITKIEPKTTNYSSIPPKDKNSLSDLERRTFQTTSALLALAQFHLAVSYFPVPNHPISISDTVRGSLKKWERWISGGFAELFSILHQNERLAANPEIIRFAQTGLEFLEQALSTAGPCMIMLSRAGRMAVPIQPVIGNACRRHLRFDKDGVRGMLDLTEIKVDSVSLDIAGILGSLAGSDARLWNLGLKIYQTLRPLNDHELFMIQVFDSTQTLLEGLDYLSDFFYKGKMVDPHRIDEMTRRLTVWNERFKQDKRNKKIA